MSSSLLPNNATSQEIALELASSRATDLPIEVGKLWDPDTCPESLLPWLAWAMSLDEWDSQWSVETRRKQIKNAVFTHSQRGTVGAVKRALASLGVTVEFLEWFEDANDVILAPVHNNQPYTFVFVAWANENPYTSQEVFLNPSLYDTIERIVNLHKPVRSHFDFLVGAKLDSEMFLGGSSTGWTQVSKSQHQTLPVQVPAGQNTVSLALTDSAHKAALGKLQGQTQAVQPASHKTGLAAALSVSRKGYMFSRISLRDE